MSLSNSRKTANSVVGHVHYASISTKFNMSFDKNAGQHVLFCTNDDNKATCELYIGAHQSTADMVIADLVKLGYTQTF